MIPLCVERDGVLTELEAWMRERFELRAWAESGLAGVEGNVERFYLLGLQHGSNSEAV